MLKSIYLATRGIRHIEIDDHQIEELIVTIKIKIEFMFSIESY